ncbi:MULTISPECIES: hypothetical protein [Paenibacillus]|uniref:hypothetical protein n=1 Tax=Paenibacillus TaxID=44249 RepID=UPI0013E9327A|nr:MULTISPECIES: hypothetical protein [Paenibacillus]KAF6582742.1 hypothetical protein G9G57_15845 [Paenibacillus sp. EKM211P]MDU8674253.1 hypothetical protein [Paenibacillus polymyxa]MDU8699161.1 hypothetical protein [Paenibacillus polymyxa]QOH60355.1 hypothetical protein DI243_02560 [Paenibacillus polymyxa]URJ53833.1 hypothetical protein MF623_003145 [Paenibacillus polymyxa]
MNVFEGANVDIWGAVGGNRLLILIGMLIFWIVVCVFISKVLDKRTTGTIAGVGGLAIMLFWVMRFLN